MILLVLLNFERQRGGGGGVTALVRYLPRYSGMKVTFTEKILVER